MKKLLAFALIFIISLLLIGCQGSENIDNSDEGSQENQENDNNGNEEEEMNEYDIFDFTFIRKAPTAEESRPLDEIIKVYFSENDSSLSNNAAIDVEKNEIHVNPRMSSLGLNPGGEVKSVEDASDVLNILDKYEVQSWDSDYSEEDPEEFADGYSWVLRLQYEDGSVRSHRGAGPVKDDITPENFDDFVSELISFVDERLDQ